MKETTLQIKNILEDSGIEESISNFIKQHPDHQNYENHISETLENYIFLKSLLLDEINADRFDSFSYSLRYTILSRLNIISINRNSVNSIMEYVDLLHNDILGCGLLNNKIGKTDFLSERKKLAEQKRRYELIIKELEKRSSDLSFIEESKKKLSGLLIETNQANSNLTQILNDVNARNTEVDAVLIAHETKLETIKGIQESIEEKKLSINTFSNNIDEYKNSIDKLSIELKNLISKKEEIDNLIVSAKEALKLGSTVGISSAFAAQYENANNGHKKKWWIIGAILFLISAISLTIWIVSDTANSEKLGVILGRIVAVGISIAGAAFCAKQYVTQKHIAEDYAYKAVLSKSIVAFTEEIGASSDNPDQHIGNYLNKVLTEIHKDPLRERKSSRRSRSLSDKQIEQITEIIKNVTK